ncbi:MAG: hypothetical protein K6E49_02680 [Lachnospiraceae bacterium]|nr:hypothetical protein [Lachnospiraceae bacterium]
MIKGIGNFQSVNFNELNRIQNDQNSVQIKQAQKEETGRQQGREQVAAPSAIDLRLNDIRPRQNATLEDISLSLNEPSGFEMKGRESDLEDLDIEKAVSDMQKDQALMQYQYFVGDSGLYNGEDGIVIAK